MERAGARDIDGIAARVAENEAGAERITVEIRKGGIGNGSE